MSWLFYEMLAQVIEQELSPTAPRHSVNNLFTVGDNSCSITWASIKGAPGIESGTRGRGGVGLAQLRKFL
jgi:hypothetical protein